MKTTLLQASTTAGSSTSRGRKKANRLPAGLESQTREITKKPRVATDRQKLLSTTDISLLTNYSQFFIEIS